MAKLKIWIMLLVYFVLVAVDIMLNVIAYFIPFLGGIAEGMTEIVIEVTSAILVLVIAFAKGGRQ